LQRYLHVQLRMPIQSFLTMQVYGAGIMKHSPLWNNQLVRGFLVSKNASTRLRFKHLLISSVLTPIGAIGLQTTSVSAQAAYGSYVGTGPAFGVTSGTGDDEDSKVSGVLAVRYKFLEFPVSLRTQLFVGNGSAIVPTVSYDIPLNYRVDAYVGIGAAVPLSDKTSPVGNKTSFAIQPGIDYTLPNSNFVVFGNTVIAIDAYEKGGNAAVSFQGGVGLRF
jgi:hypothetical protein